MTANMTLQFICPPEHQGQSAVPELGPVGTNVPSVGKPDPIVAQWHAPIVAAARMEARYAGKGTIPALVRRVIRAVAVGMLDAADLTVDQRHALAQLYRDTVAHPEE